MKKIPKAGKKKKRILTNCKSFTREQKLYYCNNSIIKFLIDTLHMNINRR